MEGDLSSETKVPFLNFKLRSEDKEKSKEIVLWTYELGIERERELGGGIASVAHTIGNHMEW